MLYDELDFGTRVAEEEENYIEDYFFVTRYWKNLLSDKTDIILGPKGSGKSALYLRLINSENYLASKNIFIFKAENPRGDTVFSLFNEMTATKEYKSPRIEALIEKDIIAFWKLYFLTLIVSELKNKNYANQDLKKVIQIFEECGLIPKEKSLKNVFRHVMHYLKQIVTLQFFQAEVELDPMTGSIKAVKGKISFEELSPQKIEDGHYTLNDLFELINDGLVQSGKKVWVAIDRLDIAFQEDLVLEKRALKSLFIVYNSNKSYSNISLKIFLRDDIWEKINIDGLREASHIIKKENIIWDKHNIFFLVLKRIVKNESICKFYGFDREKVLKNVELQNKLFYSIFPDTIEDNEGNDIDTFDWIIDMLKDGNDLFTPREIIHFLNEVNLIQEELLNLGIKKSNNKLYSQQSLEKALFQVSRVKLEQTLLAENPHFVNIININFKYSNSIVEIEWLKESMGFEKDSQAYGLCDSLMKVGFLKRLNAKQYKIPNLYHRVLS